MSARSSQYSRNIPMRRMLNASIASSQPQPANKLPPLPFLAIEGRRLRPPRSNKIVPGKNSSLGKTSKKNVVSSSKSKGQNYRKQPKQKSLRSKVGSTLTPSNRTVWLEYVSELPLSTGVTKQNFGYPIYSNGAFAVDPSSPSGFTTTPGFSVLATNYAAYRVKSYRGSITFSNTFAASGSTVVCHTNTALGAASGGTSPIDILQFAANRPTINTIRPIAATGNGASQVTHHFSHRVSKIAGESIMQPGYKSATNTVPSLLTYIVFGWYLSTAVSSFTMTVNVRLCMEVEFLDYIDTLTSFASEEERLKSLGTPSAFQPCAGCRYYETLEAAPCPDPDCHCVDKCTNCGATRKCIALAQSVSCPWRADLALVTPPVLTKTNSRTSILSSKCQ